MKLVRTSIAVASVFCALAWSGQSFAQSSGSTDTNKDADQKTETKTTKKTTTKTTKAKNHKGSDTSHAKSGSGSSGSGSSASGSTSGSGSSTGGSGSSTSGSGSSDTSGTSGSSLSGSSGTSGSSTDTSGVTGSSGSTSGSTLSGSGSTGTSGSSGTMSGTGQTIGTGTDMNGTGSTGTTGTTGTGTMGQSNMDSSGSVYPLGTQSNMNQGQYGTQQPVVPQTTTSTTQTTSAVYDPSVTADREGGTTTIRPNRPLLVTGSAIFLGSYAATAIQGAVSPLSADRKNLIPVAGPWINMSERPCNLNTNCSTKENVNNALLIGSGVAQGAGIAIALISLVVPEHKERSTIATAKAEPPKPSMMVVPASVGQAGAGAFAVGSF